MYFGENDNEIKISGEKPEEAKEEAEKTSEEISEKASEPTSEKENAKMESENPSEKSEDALSENLSEEKPEEIPSEMPEEEPSEKLTEEISEGDRTVDDGEKEQPRYERNGNYDDYSERNRARTGENRGKPKGENVYMSKKTVGLIVALCLVVSIVCGVCVNAISGVLFRGNSGTTTIGEQAGSSSGIATKSTSASTALPIVPISTDDAKNIPTVNFVTGEAVLSSYADVVERCVNSVVQIEVTEETESLFGTYETVGAGSGVIYTTDGYIVTNYHVVGASSHNITVILFDGTMYEGLFICGDESMDVSVIKINKSDCTFAKIADSSELRLGEDVIAIGNPLGYGITVSEGIISALSRKITVENTTMTLMQTTAAINSGNSGGGLFNMKGELIGITNAKVGGTSVEAMGYAIPSERVVHCINDFSKYGYVTGMARLGITANANGIVYGGYSYIGYGIQVIEVRDGGTAAFAGIRADDIIHSIDGTVCSSFSVLTELLTRYKVGDTITVDIRRPTMEKSTRVSFYDYYDACEIIELQVTFVEFNPNK